MSFFEKLFFSRADGRFRLFALIFCLSVVLFTGCGRYASAGESAREAAGASVKESAKESVQNSDADKGNASSRDLSSLDNTIQNWGQGVQFNSENQPVSSLDFQEKYASFQADFIGPEEKVVWLTFDEGYENGHTE